MDYGIIRSAVKDARQAFENKFAATGLNGWPCRSGYVVTGWGNEGRKIREVLQASGLEFDMNLSGAFLVSNGEAERAAIRDAYPRAQAAESAPAAPFRYSAA